MGLKNIKAWFWEKEFLKNRRVPARPPLNGLLGCPCCGESEGAVFLDEITEENTDEQTTGHYVECYNCGLRTATWATPEIATAFWNRRESS